MTLRRGLLALAAVALLAAGMARPVRAVEVPYKAVATTGMVADLVRTIAGERAEVTGLLGEGVDPHLYKLTRSDVAMLTRADIVFYNGLLLEGKMTDALRRVGAAGRPVHAAAEMVGTEHLLAPPEFAGEYDPHIWMDVALWMRAAEAVRDRLSAFDPAGAPVYAANAGRYLATLGDLDRYARSTLETIPKRSRVLVTAHDAFNYLGRAYGLRVEGIQGISTESESGLRRIEELVNLLVERRTGAVFVETSVSERNVRALIDGAAARGHTVVIGGNLYSDAMGAPGSYEGTYVGMIDHNVTTIVRALGGEAPAQGFQGRLAALATDGRRP